MKELLIDLKKNLQEIEEKYLKSHIIDPLEDPNDYDLDVKAYCLLAHAAFEDFIESLVLKLVHQTIHEYIYNKKVNDTLVSLMHYKSNGSSFLKDNISSLSDFKNTYDINREALNNVKFKISIEIFDNHGISFRHLSSILNPVALDVNPDTRISESLKKLSEERGNYAHKSKFKGNVKKSVSPEEAKTIIKDCLEFFEDLYNKAISKQNFAPV